MAFRLLDLPHELVALVLDKVVNLNDLCSLARVCRWLHNYTESRIYASIHLRKADGVVQSRLLARALELKPDRAFYIQRFHIHQPECVEGGDYEELPRIISFLTHLENLIVEAPACYSIYVPRRMRQAHVQKEAGELLGLELCSRILREIPYLPSLRSCTLYTLALNDPNLRALRKILVHPTLVSLRISRLTSRTQMRLPRTLRHHELHRSTTLSSLRLEQCDIPLSLLADILNLPRAFESLTFIECQDPTYRARSAQHDRNELIAAIRPQIPSLKSLTLELLPFTSEPPDVSKVLDLSKFQQLDHLSLDVFTFLMMGTSAHKCSYGTSRYLPPTIRSLKVESAFFFRHRFGLTGSRAPLLSLVKCMVASKVAHGIPKLERLELSFSATDHAADRCIGQIEEIGMICKKNGIRLLVYGDPTQDGWTPPFFHEDPKPAPKLEYDSSM